MANLGEPAGASQGYNHATAVQTYILNRANALGVGLEPDNVQICPAANTDCGSSQQIGGPKELIAVNLQKDMSILGLGNITVSGLAIGRNEPDN